MTTDKTYSTRANAARAARTALAERHPRGAISGVHFRIIGIANDDGYGWETIDDGGPAPAKAQTTRAAKKTNGIAAGIQEAIASTKDKTPTPPPRPDPAALYAALGGTIKTQAPRWRRPKRTPCSKVAYRPRVGSLQEHMYNLLTRVNTDDTVGITVESFCDEMASAGAKPTMTRHEQTWSNLGYLFVSLRGYGLEFDGTRVWLLVPRDERDAVAKKGG